jgi:hypothetical protein
MYYCICGSFKSAKNNLVRKSQNRKLIHLRNVLKSKQCPQIGEHCDLRNLFADRPPFGNLNVFLGAAAGAGEHQSRDGGPQHGAQHKDL